MFEFSQSLEKFSSMTQDVSLALDSFTRRLAEIEFPNNTIATTTLLSQQQAEYNELKEEILSAARHGEALLDSVRQLTGKATADRLGNVAAVERYLDLLYYPISFHYNEAILITTHIDLLLGCLCNSRKQSEPSTCFGRTTAHG